MKQYFIMLIIFMSCHGNQAFAQIKVDHHKLVNEFISTLNSKDLNEIEGFVMKNFSANALSRWGGNGKDRYIGYTMNAAIFHGELASLATNLDNSNNRIRHISKVHSKNTDMQHEMVVFFNNDQQRPITGWYINADPQSDVNKTSLTETQFFAEIKAYTDKLANNGVFSGTVMLAKGNKVLFSAAHGLASHRYDVKNNLKTKFQIGSMNKMFTSVAILQLIDIGKISLNDSLTKFIDRKLLGKGDFDKIQISHLLSHTSGIGNIVGLDELQNKVRSLEDISHLYSTIDTRFEPGSQWRYSNTGMIMLGQIIEKVSGNSYFDHVAQHVYQAANMQNSGSFDLDVPVKNTARNYWYSIETEKITENLMYQSVKGGPAGGGYSTVGDLHKFALAMQTGKLLNSKLANEALTAKPELNAPNWGYGFSVRGREGNQIVGHNGSHLGMTARLNIYKDKGYILVVLGNYQSSAWPIVAKVDQLIQQL